MELLRRRGPSGRQRHVSVCMNWLFVLIIINVNQVGMCKFKRRPGLLSRQLDSLLATTGDEVKVWRGTQRPYEQPSRRFPSSMASGTLANPAVFGFAAGFRLMFSWYASRLRAKESHASACRVAPFSA